MATVQKETVVKEELCKFLKHHSLDHSIENVDEVVLEYVITILEELGAEGSDEDDIDVDSFVEMMDAYVPGFGEINSIEVIDWMFKLAASLTQKEKVQEEGRTRHSSSISDEIVAALTVTNSDEQNGNSKDVEEEDEEDEEDEQVKILLEMFPGSCTMEVTHCLGLANRETEVAAQLILDRQESGESIKPQKQNVNAPKKSKGAILDDKNLKDKMIAQYSYVDADEHKKSYTPIVPKQDPKKMVRYLENRIVSTKGEKFTEIKKEDSEEMKKTYVNLKPARKYRFH